MLSPHIEKMIKRRRELLAIYLTTNKGLWRRVYPESFYESTEFVSLRELGYIRLIYEVFLTVINGHRKTLIEDEINLMYMDIESKAASGGFTDAALSVIKGRLDLRAQTIEKIRSTLMVIESEFLDIFRSPLNIKFRLESTVYLVRLLAYGLFSSSNIVLERVAEVFDITKLQDATMTKDKQELDETLRFLYKGLIQKNERGRQGSTHAAKQTLLKLIEWYPDNNYVLICIDTIWQYL